MAPRFCEASSDLFIVEESLTSRDVTICWVIGITHMTSNVHSATSGQIARFLGHNLRREPCELMLNFVFRTLSRTRSSQHLRFGVGFEIVQMLPEPIRTGSNSITVGDFIITVGSVKSRVASFTIQNTFNFCQNNSNMPSSLVFLFFPETWLIGWMSTSNPPNALLNPLKVIVSSSISWTKLFRYY